ncbi:XRE family transcriptional regulator [Eikenella corrodens]|uniref:XRE family transcriptional regulator n=1 Tax=Eikenella corrodens TaxID=539 RepID=UPI00129A10C2|nr:S24 family peptidase [Eikenella corrodens]
MSNSNLQFADRMAKILELFNGNVSELARQAGIAPPSAQRWIDGESDPKMSNLLRLADATNVNLLWLATGQGPMFASGANRLKEPQASYNVSEQDEGRRLLQQRLAETKNTLNNIRKAERGESTGEGCAFDVQGRPVDIDEFVFIPLYDVALSAGHGAWADDIPPKSTLAFRRDWLEAFVTTDFHNLSVVMVKGDSMAGVLNDKDAILVDHSRTEASDGLYALRIGNEIFVKRVQRLPHALLVTSENPQYKPFEVPLQNGDSSDSSVSIIGKVVWLGRAL